MFWMKVLRDWFGTGPRRLKMGLTIFRKYSKYSKYSEYDKLSVDANTPWQGRSVV